jgi:YidC/Oxa1 family membrane protein insertase
MRKMQEFAPEMQKLRAKYGNDKQKLTAEMQKLQSQQGVNPLGGCLPVLVQVPVFIGLFHVLREFEPGKTENYVFDASEVESFNAASLFGAKLGAWVTMGSEELARLGTTIPEMLVVMIPLMIAAGIFTHITARHSVARQTEAQLANPQAAIMNKMMLYIFPIGVVVGAPFLPLAVLIYWVANNLWTLGQQYVVYRRIDAEEEEKKTQVIADRQARAPRPGQKPVRPEAAARPGNAAMTPDGKTPGAKPVARRTERADGQVKGTASTAADGTGAAAAHGASPNGAAAQSPATGAEANGAGTKGTGASATRSRTGASRPPARRPRRRR